MIEVSKLTKKYKNNIIFENIDITFEPNKIHFIMGKNGIGKTSFLKCLLGLDRFLGSILFSENLKGNIFAIFDDTPLYNNLNGFKNIALFLNHKCIEKEKILKIGLLNERVLKSKVENYSLGERKKLNIIIASLSNASYIIMDETSNGLDIEALEEFQFILKNLKEKSTIIMTGHHLEFYNNVVDKFYILNNRKLTHVKEYEEKKGDLYELYNQYIYSN